MGDSRRVLVLGATGFLGTHVHRALEAAGDVVVAVPGSTQTGGRPRFDLSTDDVGRLIRETGPDVVVNCAGRAMGATDVLEAANVTVVRRLLDALARHPGRLVHLGSAAEYGPGVPGRPTREDDLPRPTATYGRTKLSATELVRSSGLDAVVLRVFNPVGPGMRPDSMPGRAARLLSEALNTSAEHITMGDLSASRDFIHAADVGEAVAVACGVRDTPPVVNIGRGEAVLARNLVDLLVEVAGYTGSVREERMTSPRSGAVDYQCADVWLARHALGWEARRTLREAVADLWAGVRAPA